MDGTPLGDWQAGGGKAQGESDAFSHERDITVLHFTLRVVRIP